MKIEDSTNPICILRVGNFHFFPQHDHSIRGFLPDEVWIFNRPWWHYQDRSILWAVEPIACCLPQHRVHRVDSAPEVTAEALAWAERIHAIAAQVPPWSYSSVLNDMLTLARHDDVPRIPRITAYSQLVNCPF